MKQVINSISIAFLVLGFLFLAVGLLFQYMRWPDMFYGIIVGPALIGIGLLLFFLKKEQ